MKLNWLDLVKVMGPMILAQTKLAAIAPFVIAGIVAAEQMPGATNTQKLAHAKTIVALTVGAVNAQKGSEVIDPDVADDALNSGIATVIAVANLVHRSPAVGSGGIGS